MDTWLCATVVVLTSGLLAEVGGGYFAFRPRIAASLEPDDLTQVFKMGKNWWWLRVWIVNRVPTDDDGRYYEWRFTIPGPPVEIGRNLVRLAIGGFFIVKIALTGSPY